MVKKISYTINIFNTGGVLIYNQFFTTFFPHQLIGVPQFLHAIGVDSSS